MLVSEILTKAKEIITPRGKWFKGDYRGPNGGYCALGATGYVCGIPSEDIEAAEFLKKALPKNIACVHIYNDAPGTRKKQILRLFDKAIALAKKEGK